MVSFPKDVVARLYDRSGWSRTKRILIAIGKLPVLACFVLIVLTPLRIGEGVFVLGGAVFALGLIGLVIALINYKNTPLDEPVTNGFYRISRNPQVLTLMTSFLGICIATSSWAAAFLLIVAAVFAHLRVLAEEKSCLEQYGDSYRGYMKRVPRYFVFF